jgi:hypothetical protein
MLKSKYKMISKDYQLTKDEKKYEQKNIYLVKDYNISIIIFLQFIYYFTSINMIFFWISFFHIFIMRI